MVATWGAYTRIGTAGPSCGGWAISIYVNPKLGITTSGRAASLDEAKAQFLASWEKCRTNPPELA
jgi:hypothetical protein